MRCSLEHQTVMSGLADPEIMAKISDFRHVCARSFASVHGVSVVNLWSVPSPPCPNEVAAELLIVATGSPNAQRTIQLRLPSQSRSQHHPERNVFLSVSVAPERIREFPSFTRRRTESQAPALASTARTIMLGILPQRSRCRCAAFPIGPRSIQSRGGAGGRTYGSEPSR